MDVANMAKAAEKPVFKTKIKTEDGKIREMALGYFIGPLIAMMANSIFSAYLTRYYADVLGLTDKQFGIYSMLLPVISTFFVIAGNLMVGGGSPPALKAVQHRLVSGGCFRSAADPQCDSESFVSKFLTETAVSYSVM